MRFPVLLVALAVAALVVTVAPALGRPTTGLRAEVPTATRLDEAPRDAAPGDQPMLLAEANVLGADPVGALSDRPSGASDSPLTHYLAAVSARRAGDHAAAADALEAARALAPTDPDLALEAARAAAAARRYGSAANAYADAAGLAPGRADLHLERARFHLGGGFRLGDALEAAEMAVALAPTDATARALLERARTAAALAVR